MFGELENPHNWVTSKKFDTESEQEDEVEELDDLDRSVEREDFDYLDLDEDDFLDLEEFDEEEEDEN